ncbi:MAG: flagellin [Alphaproteobacteria bacterium]|nr:flagellin [Alphaproteobacteria bacterium]
MATVNTNVGAMVALQNLNATNKELEIVQNRINTGLKVATAKDNGAVYAIAQNMRSDVAGLNAVQQSLDRAISTVDVGIAAAEGISDLLIEMKEKSLAASDSSLDTASRDALNEDFTALRDQITTMVDNALFNGVNIIDGSVTSLAALADADGTATITVGSENLGLSGSIITIATTGNIGTQTDASAMISTVETSLQNLNEALARLGTNSKKLEIHSEFITKLSDSLTAGIGNLVDADLAVESSRLQSLQVKQQLGVQALSIANAAPQTLLSLFG